uniref:Uncharacterized protein n=1 Tax=Rhizophora mucronata TaxID=61149 RepID=A0A2P2LXH6_RHIMU
MNYAHKISIQLTFMPTPNINPIATCTSIHLGYFESIEFH